MSAPAVLAFDRMTPAVRAAVLDYAERERTAGWVAGWDAAEREFMGEFPALTDDQHRATWRRIAQSLRPEVAA